MKIVIPMAGLGQRFIDAGYKQPKPMIEVAGSKIIEYILAMFDLDDEIVFICNETHIKNGIKDQLKKLRPDAEILSIPDHKKGPVYTVQVAYDLIKDDEEVIICYCDNPHVWNRKDFNDYLKENKLDGCILTHIGFHPHTLNKTKMAFTKLNDDGLLEEIKEKECYTDDPMSEHASTGMYYFRKGEFVKKYFDEMIEKDINYKGEYYVTLVYNLLVRDKMRVGVYDTPYVTVFGTPEEVKNFEAWNTILNGGQIKNEQDLIQCYKYWINYGESLWKMKYK